MSEWKFFATNSVTSAGKNTREEQLQKEWRFLTAIKNLKRLTLKELIEESEEAELQVAKANTSLMEAYNKKKLKSAKLIQQVKTLKKQKNAIDTPEVITEI